MKQISVRAIGILLIAGLYVIALVIYVTEYAASADKWATNPRNTHIYTDGVLNVDSVIYDRNGVVLQTVDNGNVTYNSNEDTRQAMLHITGDPKGNIASAVSITHSKELVGYNLVDGVYDRSGNEITLTTDSDVNVLAHNLLGNRKGAVNVYNYKTGEIYVMATTPAFDPQVDTQFDADDDTYEGVYLDRNVSAAYPPGSTMKIVTSAAAIDNIDDIFTQTWDCTGSVTIDGDAITCTEVHGEVDFREAFTHSCNVAYADISIQLGKEALTEYADKMAFNTDLVISRFAVPNGHFDVSTANNNELAWAGIGQYTDLTSPAVLMAMAGAIPNGGVPVTPRIINDVGSGVLPSTATSTNKGKRQLSQDTANILKDMMIDNVNNYYGTDLFPGLTVGAKTGTAEIEDKEPIAWFVGFCTDEKLPVAFAVAVEDAGLGIDYAAPIASDVIMALNENLNG